MVHMLRLLKCKNGHSIGLGYDSNECGCHHNGKPCLVIDCKTCFEEALKDGDDQIPYSDKGSIYIPLGEEGNEVIKKLIKGGDTNG